jgi:hypothetical protein
MNNWGVMIVFDTMNWGQENLDSFADLGDQLYLWVYLDLAFGWGYGEFDKDAVAWMGMNNGGVQLSEKADASFSSYFAQMSGILGLVKRWTVGESVRFELGGGVEGRFEQFSLSNKDIEGSAGIFSVGPVVRLSVRY